jgi:hypothetical protein
MAYDSAVMLLSSARQIFGGMILLWLGLPGAGRGVAGDFEFVVIGDTRPRFESENFRLFEGLIAKINAAQPALVVNLGDLIYGYGPMSKEKQWDKYQRVIKAIQAPYYQVPGNHDTHSKEARRIYTRRFGKCYQSLDYGGCHFVLLDNTEAQRWGYMGPTELEWLKTDLRQTKAQSVFVFMHFPVWEPERVTPQSFQFWAETLHPLFKASHVLAVFAGHYHSYGPSREFDGIRYFITGGGGAELRPEYKKSGGEHHFVKVKVSGENCEVRVVTERGELSDAEADVMGGLQFAEKHSSRIGIEQGTQDLRQGVSFSVSLNNPYDETLAGKAEWICDASAFAVEPASVSLQIPPGKSQQQNFTLKALRDAAVLGSLPRLEFNVGAGGRRLRFHRDVLFIQKTGTPYARAAPVLDGALADWEGVPVTTLGEGTKAQVQIRTSYNEQNLFLAITVPTMKTGFDDDDEGAFSDQLQLGIARRLSNTDFSGDFLRLGFNAGATEARDRTPGRKTEGVVPGVKTASKTRGDRTDYEIAVPLRLLKHRRSEPESRLVIDLSFPAPDGESEEAPEPKVNTFAYRVRYGSDSLVPVYFVELKLEEK